MGVRGSVDRRYNVVLHHALRQILVTMDANKIISTIYADVEFMYHVWLEGGGSHYVVSN